MSERERWIVYPLLFFALGAAIRDKLFHQVATGDLLAETVQAESLVCEGLTILDPDNPTRKLAQVVPVTTLRQKDGKPYRYSFGALILTDSEDEELFGVANDQLQMRGINCDSIRATGSIYANEVAVVDPHNPTRKLAQMRPITEIREEADPSRYSYGAVILTDSQDAELFGVANDRLRMRQVQCEGIQIIDPAAPGRVLLSLPPPGFSPPPEANEESP